MSGIVENFIRRIEKLVSVRATVPVPGTNHIDDVWLSTDIYPGELSIGLSTGSLYTSDGVGIVDLNRENAILQGLNVSRDSSGVNKLTVQSGSVRINGKTYVHTSSGTDIYISPNLTVDTQLYFIFGVATSTSVGNGNYSLNFDAIEVSGGTDINGIFNDVSSGVDYPSAPQDSILLATVLLKPGATGFDLYPLSVVQEGDYFPKLSYTPSEFLRLRSSAIDTYEYNTLYFPSQFIVDYLSNTTYLAKQLFVSDSSLITNDISAGNLEVIAGGGGTGGAYSSLSLGTGAEVYKTTVGTQFRFRSIIGDNPITVVENVNDVTIGLSMSGFVTGITNVGSGTEIYRGLSGTVAELRSLTAGSSKLSIGISGNNIVIDVPAIGTTARGVMLGTTGPAIYAGMSGDNLSFRRILGGTGMSVLQNANDLTISTTARNNNGVNLSGGSGLIYSGMSGDNLAFRSLTAGSNVTIVTSGDNVVISSTGGTPSAGINIGATVGQIYAGLSGTDLTFRSVIPGYGIAISEVGNNVLIDSTLVDGAQGNQGRIGPQGALGPQGLQGFQGFQGFQGANGTNGINGAQGRQGFRGFQGDFGPQGFAGADGANAPLTNQRFIDIYDSVGSASIPSTSNRILNFGTTRTNTDTVLYQLGSVTQIAPNGTYVEIAEDGYYTFEYSISLSVSAGAFIKAYLWNNSTSTKVNGSDIWFNTIGVTETITSSGSVILDVAAGDRYSIRLESVSGSATTQQNASKFSITQLEIGYGAQGFQGSGVQGAQGILGPQGSLGPQGVQGIGGPQGATSGIIGPQGTAGPQGVPGATGPINTLSQIIITTSVNITTNTLDGSGIDQQGKNVIIDNGSNNIQISVDTVSGFNASYLKHGTGSVTFVQGSGRTLVQVDGTAVLNGVPGSTAIISSVSTTDYLRISNA